MIGICLCGGVEFELGGEIPNLYQCHCSQCHKQGGSSSNTATIVSRENFTWKAGEHLISEFKHATGFNSHFCSVCGSPVPNRLGDNRFMWIPAGMLADTDRLEIVAHLCVDSKASWDKLEDNEFCYNEMLSLDHLTNILSRKNTFE